MLKRYLILLPSGELYSVDGVTWSTVYRGYAKEMAGEGERVLEIVLEEIEDEAS